MTRSQPPGQWAYVYQLASPVDDSMLSRLDELLVEENSLTRRRHLGWTARLVVEGEQTRILIVCDSPAQDRKVNRRLEALLRRLGTEFSVTVPMAVEDDITPITRPHRDPT